MGVYPCRHCGAPFVSATMQQAPHALNCPLFVAGDDIDARLAAAAPAPGIDPATENDLLRRRIRVLEEDTYVRTVKRKIVFLDFDGVLNSNGYFREVRAKVAAGTIATEDDRDGEDVDPVAVLRLNELVARTDAGIVVSSSWRHGRDVKALRTVLEGRGLMARILGQTPDYTRLSSGELGARGDEIRAWLRGAALYGIEVEAFVILDDSADMAQLGPWLVQTSMETGLLDEHVERAVQLLAVQPGLALATAEEVARFAP